MVLVMIWDITRDTAVKDYYDSSESNQDIIECLRRALGFLSYKERICSVDNSHNLDFSVPFKRQDVEDNVFRCDTITSDVNANVASVEPNGLATGQNTKLSRRIIFDELMSHTKAVVVSFEVLNPRSGQTHMKADVNNTIRPLEEKKHKLKEAMCAKQPDSHHKYQNWKRLEKDLLEIPETLYICINLALEAAQKLKTRTTDEGLLQQLNYAKEQLGSLVEFYKDTGHQTGNSMFHALMLACFADAWFWQAKLAASSRKQHIEKRGSRAVRVGSQAVQVGSRDVHNGLLDAGVELPVTEWTVESVKLIYTQHKLRLEWAFLFGNSQYG
ncbi:hypothetical protein Tco_1375936 [Tanacetum coccineum]